MIEKRRLLKLAVASLVFAGFAFWIYSSILGSYRKFESERSLREVELLAKSVPALSNIDDWIGTLPSVFEGRARIQSSILLKAGTDLVMSSTSLRLLTDSNFR
jgi:hypothetical protein